MNRTDRLVGLLIELQGRGEARAEDLAARFEVSVRTIYRDLQALSESGVPLLAMPGRGYKLMEGYWLPPLNFTVAEAAVLALGAGYVRERVDAELRAAASDALSKLVGVLPPEKRAAVEQWRAELHFFGSNRGDPARLTTLRQAIHERRVVWLAYHGRQRGEPTEREVEPFALAFVNEVWHLVAYCRLRAAARIFRLDRIDQLEPRAEQFALADRHVVDPPSASGWSDGYPEARARFDATAVRWARERQPWTFKREEAGPTFVYARRDDAELVRWLLGWGDSVIEVEPPELAAQLADEARRIAERHAPDKIEQMSKAVATS